jgi:sortase A
MNRRLTIALTLAMASALFFGNAAYLYAKAALGQFLLERAWSRAVHGERGAKPWSWADTTPLARLEFARERRSYIVLSGASGRTMAWAPGHVDGTAMPGASGNCVISAHRDTHFSVLRSARVGDVIRVATRDGRRIPYRVSKVLVTDDRDTKVLAPADGRLLTLITCWPFDAIRPGGHERFVVIARGV